MKLQGQVNFRKFRTNGLRESRRQQTATSMESSASRKGLNTTPVGRQAFPGEDHAERAEWAVSTRFATGMPTMQLSSDVTIEVAGSSVGQGKLISGRPCRSFYRHGRGACQRRTGRHGQHQSPRSDRGGFNLAGANCKHAQCDSKLWFSNRASQVDALSSMISRLTCGSNPSEFPEGAWPTRRGRARMCIRLTTFLGVPPPPLGLLEAFCRQGQRFPRATARRDRTPSAPFPGCPDETAKFLLPNPVANLNRQWRLRHTKPDGRTFASGLPVAAEAR